MLSITYESIEDFSFERMYQLAAGVNLYFSFLWFNYLRQYNFLAIEIRLSSIDYCILVTFSNISNNDSPLQSRNAKFRKRQN